ncbi:unnamed protein product [Blepharisma stoltei]|uniref:Uncharacterized protein n=1 Tax=Blepharisma stoltei TaxID=1481888 RepID=A0AAU9J9H8_9CILI|nr:unnamed protein product [Blepharisma stoltei]
MLRLSGFFRQPSLRFARTFQERQQEKNLKKQEESFKKYLEDISSKEVYYLRDFKQEIMELIKNSGNALSKFWQSGTQIEEAEKEKTKKILNAFHDSELTEERFELDTKKEIALVSGYNVDDVNKVLRQFRLNQKIHRYLKERREKGEPLPENRNELDNMVLVDPPKRTREEKKRSQGSYSKKQLKYVRYSRGN